MQTLSRLTFLVLVAAAAQSVANADDTGVAVPANPGPITLVDQLGADEAYCVDILGGSAESGDGMQAHSCHNRFGPAADQEFTTDYPNVGNIYVTQADLCVEARRVRAGGLLRVVGCSTSTIQSWIASSDGKIHPVDDMSLCMTVEPGPRDGTAYNRGLTLETCADFNARLTTWSIPGGSIGI